MKNVAYLLIAILMVSCGSNGTQSKYEIIFKQIKKAVNMTLNSRL